MPNRIIKESICTSDNLDKLSAFQETMFYRLIVNCDDFGRMDARAKILASKLFPLKDISVTQIEEGLRALTSAELVILYEVDGKPFLQMKTWDSHQQVRARRSKYPSPEEGKITGDNVCNQMISNDSKCPRNPIQSESNPNPNPNSLRERAREEKTPPGFDRFWETYPRRTAKAEAIKAFVKLKPDAMLIETMVKAIQTQRQSAQWQEEGGRFIPHPATWINQRRWEDELPKGGGKPLKIVNAAKCDQRSYSEEELAGDAEDAMMKEAEALMAAGMP